MLGYVSSIKNSLPDTDLDLLQHRRWKPVDYYHKMLHLGCCSSPRSAYNHVYVAAAPALPTPMSIEEILDLPIHLNSWTKLDFSSDQRCFYCIAPQNISDNYN